MKRLKLGNISAPYLLLILSILLIGLVVLIYSAENWSEDKIITEFRVVGNNYVKSDDIIKPVKSYAYSKAKKDIKLDSISKLLNKNPYIIKCDINYGISGELIVTVFEREPCAYLIKTNGQLFLSDITGFLFSNDELPENPDLPVIFDNNTTNNKSLKIALKLISSLKNQNPDLEKEILEYYLDNDKRVLYAKDRFYNLKLLLSTEYELLPQLVKYRVFLKNYNKFPNFSNINYLDLRWDKKLIIGYKA